MDRRIVHSHFKSNFSDIFQNATHPTKAAAPLLFVLGFHARLCTVENASNFNLNIILYTGREYLNRLGKVIIYFQLSTVDTNKFVIRVKEKCNF